MTARSALVVAALLAALMPAVAVAQSAGPHGTWLTQAGDAKVRIKNCGNALCGSIVWLKQPIDPNTGKAQVDDKNSDPSRASRPVMGLTIFSDMRAVSPGKWSGHIYNADDGKTYESSISHTGPTTLQVEGCVGALCGGETWTLAGR
jgi:uncharacterized protein (DUF2147 family)